MAATAKSGGSRPLAAPAPASASASALSPSSAAAEAVVPRWLKGAFRTALEIIRQLPKDGPVQFSQEDKFKFYGLYQQAVAGPNTVDKPAFYDVVAVAKWTSWKSLRNISRAEAMRQYIDLLVQTLERFRKADPQVPRYLEQLRSAVQARDTYSASTPTLDRSSAKPVTPAPGRTPGPASDVPTARTPAILEPAPAVQAASAKPAQDVAAAAAPANTTSSSAPAPSLAAPSSTLATAPPSGPAPATGTVPASGPAPATGTAPPSGPAPATGTAPPSGPAPATGTAPPSGPTPAPALSSALALSSARAPGLSVGPAAASSATALTTSVTSAAEVGQVANGLNELEKNLEQVADKLHRLDSHQQRAVAVWRRRFWIALVPLLFVFVRYVLVPRYQVRRRKP